MTKDISRIKRIAADAFNPDGTVKPFAEQVEAYRFEELRSGSVLVFPKSSSDYHLPFDGSDWIILKQKDLRKIVVDHEIGWRDVCSLDQWLDQHPLVMESLSVDGALVIFADARDIDGNEIIMSLHARIEQGQKELEIFVDRISSVYGKRDASNLIKNTAKLGKAIYVNEKTKDWLLRTGVQFPEPSTNPVYNEYTKNRTETLDPSAILAARNDSTFSPKSKHSYSPKDDLREAREALRRNRGDDDPPLVGARVKVPR